MKRDRQPDLPCGRRGIFVAQERKGNRRRKDGGRRGFRQKIHPRSHIEGHQQEEADRNRAKREDDPANPAGAFKGRRNDDGQHRDERPAPWRGKPRQDQHGNDDTTCGRQMLRDPARLEEPAMGRLILR